MKTQSATTGERKMLTSVEKDMWRRGFLAMQSQWTKIRIKGSGGSSGFTLHRTSMIPRDGEVKSLILEVMVMDGQVSLISVYSRSECFLPSEI